MRRVLWVTAGEAIPALPTDTALVWHGRLDDPGASAVIAQAALTPDDRAELARRPQAEWRAARRRLTRALLARLALAHPDTIGLKRSPFGAVRVVTPAGWWISVAGQGGLCAVAVSKGPVGVDIEPLDQPELPDDLFTAQELGADGSRLARWTAKEAHAKRFGRADIADPRLIQTAFFGEGLIARSADGASRCFVHRSDAAIVAVALPA